MFDTQVIKQSFGRAAPAYDTHAHVQRSVRAHAVALARECWAPAAHVLDAGSGTGALVDDIRRLGLLWRVTGLDLSPGMCRVAQAHDHRTVNADAASMPFAAGQFDGVFSSLMLQWANDPAAVLREMRRVIKPHGHAVVATLIHGTLAELRDAFAALDDAPHVSHFLTKEALQRMAEDAGFAVVTSVAETVTEHHPDLVSVMRSLKAIGAANKDTNRRRGLMTPYQLAQVERAYRRDKAGLPVTWRPCILVLGA